MDLPSDLFAGNRAWARRTEDEDPGLFERLTRGQSPPFFWVGCSDSRVPANRVLDLPPGELFVHRNVANVVAPGDANGMSALQYAVDALQVEHVIVCGHYGCGGVRAVLDDARVSGPLDRWLEHVRRVRDDHADELAGVEKGEARWRRLCELNVEAQVSRVASTTVVQKAWEEERSLAVHGWIYELADGILHDLEVTRETPP